MEIFDFSFDYTRLIDPPTSNAEKVWQQYFSQVDNIFEQNQIVFINKRTDAFDDKEIEKINLEYEKLLNEEKVLLLKAEKQYSELFKKSYKNPRQIRNCKIRDWLPYVERIDYLRGGIMGFYIDSVIMMDQEAVVLEKNFTDDYKVANQITKRDLLDCLFNLDLGYWSEEYVSEAITVCDGVSWNLKFTFIKGKRCKELNFSGNNCFPHNFDEFESLLKKK